MTDDNVRPEATPSRESRPGGPEKPVTDEAAAEVEDVAESFDAVEGEGAVKADDAGDSAESTIEADATDEVTDESEVEVARADDAGAADEAAVEGGEEMVDTPSEPESEAIIEPDTEVEAESATDTIEDEETAPSGTDVAEETVEAPTDTVDAAETEVESPDADASSVTEAETAAPAAPVSDEKVEEMSEVAAGDTFTWHPEYQGKTFDEVRASLAQDIASDQRQHRLAMDGAEESEQEALASVVGLERKWGKFDFDWAEQEPEALADRIFDFERERERRQQMISWSEYRDADIELDEAQAMGERPAELSTSAKGLSLLLVVLLIVVILLAVWAL